MSTSLKILWIDDDLEATAAWESTLARYGFQVSPAESGTTALRQLETHTFDLILVDLSLAGDESGIDVIASIRQRDTLTPIFVLSGYLNDDRYRAQLDRLVLQGLIPKPLPADPDQLEKIMLEMELACRGADIARLQAKYGGVSVAELVERARKGRSCFVIMPFAPVFSPIYEDVIRQVLVEKGIACVRADELYGVTAIIEDITHAISKADFLIAELTSRNPNVLYELGYAHAIEKPVIMLTQDINDVPFDLRHRRCICYSIDHRGVNQLRNALSATVDAVVRALPWKETASSLW